MIIKLKRKWYDSSTTIGKLYVNGVFVAYTLEDRVRPKGEKVAGETAIPYGTYPVDIIWWQKHQMDVPIIRNVPGFTGILVHPGNDQYDTAGCLLVGESVANGKLVNSAKAFNKLIKIIKPEIEAGKKVKLKVINYPLRLFLTLTIIILATYLILKSKKIL